MPKTALAVTVTLHFLFTSLAAAQPAKLFPAGAEVQLNVATSGNQQTVAVAESDDGFIVVWSGDGIVARRFDTQGMAVSDELTIGAPGTFPAVAAWPDGRSVVAWDSGASVLAQVLAADGTPVGSPFEVVTGTAAQNPDVAVNSDGFVVVWSLSGPSDILGRRYDSVGTAVGAEFQINSHTPADQRRARIRRSPDDTFAVVWDSDTSAGNDSTQSIQFRRLGTDGAPQGQDFQVNSYTTDTQAEPAIDFAADGSFVVVWSSYLYGPGNDDSYAGVVARRFDSAGNPRGDDFQVNTYTPGYQYPTDVRTSPDGGFVVVWNSIDEGSTDPSEWGVMLRRYDSTGAPIGDQLVVNTLTSGDQIDARLAMHATGDFLVVWESEESAGGDTDGESVQGRLFLTEADVGVSKTDGVTTAVPGEGVVYTIVVSNDGPDAATGVELDDPLPMDLSCEWESVADGGATGNTASGGGDLDETLLLPANSSVTYTLDCTIAPDATGNLTNTAMVLADQVDANSSNDTAFDTDALEPSTDLALALGAESLFAVAGDEAVLVATVTDDGPSSSTGSTVTLDLPTGLTFVGSVACGHVGGTVTCDLGAIDPAGALTAEVTVLFDAGLPGGTELTVFGTVVADEPDPDASDDADSVTLVVATPIFRDGFESGDLTAWPSSVP